MPVSILTNFLTFYRTIEEMDTQTDFIATLERVTSGTVADSNISTSGSRKAGINRVLGRLAHNIDALADTFQILRTMTWEATSGTYVVYDSSAHTLTINNDAGSGSNILKMHFRGIASKSSSSAKIELKFSHGNSFGTFKITQCFIQVISFYKIFNLQSLQIV